MGLELKKSKVKLIFEKQQKFIGFFCFAGRIHRSLLFDDKLTINQPSFPKKMRTFASEGDKKSPDQKAWTRVALAGKDLNNTMAHGDTLSF